MKAKYRKCTNGVEVALSGFIVDNESATWYRQASKVDVTCPVDIEEALELANGDTVTILVDSPGGSLIAGATIYTALMSYPGSLLFRIRSLAGSAASIVTAASAKEGSSCEMSPMALYFLHNVQGGAEGDYRDMEDAAGMLKTANKTAVSAYKLRTGMTEAEITSMMDAGTWLSAEDAVAKGFVDKVMFVDTEHDTARMAVSMANLLTNYSGQLMEALPHPPRQLHAEPPQPTDDDIAHARAMLDIENNRF